MNKSELTRKDQVLEYLARRRWEWVDGPDIANEAVGGSEGHRRMRELRAAGHLIEERRHPDPTRDIWQYRLMGENEKGLIRVEREGKPDQYISPRRAAADAISDGIKFRTLTERREAMSSPRIPPGALRVQWGDRICGTCNGTGGNLIDACLRCGGTGKVA